MMVDRLRQLLPIMAALLLMVGLTHWFPMGITILELLGAFAPFTFLLSIIVLTASLLYRKWAGMAFSLASAVLCGTLVLPHFSPLKSTDAATFTIGQFNVYHGNVLPRSAFYALKEANADILIVQEQNTRWEFIIDSLLNTTYPFRTTEPWRDCCYGIGLYSKFPILKKEIFEMEGTPAIRATVDVNGTMITVITFHTRPPVFPNMTKERNRQLDTVAEMAQQTTGPLIVIGDLNVVPWDDAFRTFLHNGGLQAVRNGFQATYPMELGVPLIPIDHITYSGPLTATSCQTVTIPGSDHRGLMAGFKFTE